MDQSLVVTTDTIRSDAERWAAKATGLVIRDAESCINASQLLKGIKAIRSDVQRWFAPHIEKAMDAKRAADAARKGLVDEQAHMEAPLIHAEGILKRGLLAFEAQQEEARRQEEARLQAEAQRQAEALTVETAAALEREAVTSGDAGLLVEAHDLITQPIEAPVVRVEPTVPKVAGVTYRDNWKAHPEIDLRALARAVAEGRAPVTFLEPNLTAINQFARATQGAQDVPGVRFYNDRQIAARR